jgi:ribosomal protein S18 acetylase RimI-like enzyme
MEVRQLGISSLETVLDVWHAANELSALTNHRSNLREWARQEGARIFGAFDGEQIVGNAFSLLTRVDDGAGEVVAGARHLTGLAVLPTHRRRGIGQALLHAVIADAQGEGVSRIGLWTHTNNEPARRLFQANGFRPTGRCAVDAVGAEMIMLELEVRSLSA